MLIFKDKYGWSTTAHSKNKDGETTKAYLAVQFTNGYEPDGESLEGDLIFKDKEGREKSCFLSNYKKKDGTTALKLVILEGGQKPKQTYARQQTLTGDDRDVLGHYDKNVVIDEDSLPFY